MINKNIMVEEQGFGWRRDEKEKRKKKGQKDHRLMYFQLKNLSQ
jgi:hypothetical protein